MDRRQAEALDRWLTTDPRDSECEGCEGQYFAHIETYDGQGRLMNIRTEPIEEWEALMRVDPDGNFLITVMTFKFADGSEMNVSRDGGPCEDCEQSVDLDRDDPVFERVEP